MAIIDMKLDLGNRTEDKVDKEVKQSGHFRYKQMNKTFLRTSHHRVNRSMEKTPLYVFEE
jgi:hypothetical protein